MTGYGRCKLEEDGREMTVEVKSVNHRFLDISCRLARHLSFLDETVRSGVSARLARGHVDVFVSYANQREDAKEVRVDTALAQAYRRAYEQLGAALGKDADIPLSEYARMPDVLTVQEREEDQDAVRALFKRALDGALTELCAMREREGENLRRDVLEKADNLEALRAQIALRAPLVVAEYRDKLRQRILALTEGEIDEARMVTEVAIFADRAAIDEELVRLLSHIGQLRAAAEETESVGRKLDFLTQELGREVNTIGSKASDAEIAHLVVAAKGEIEKLREQVQNVE
ncbi:MAG: YicC/YloC family endoribonuclease [Clostridia bacterium]|nr:YicC/YloC family endoribonuclease [Clostridia bacterium]